MKKFTATATLILIISLSPLHTLADGPGGGNNYNPSWSGATTITDSASYSEKNFSSTSSDENSVLISGGPTLTNPTVTKTGGPSGMAGDEYSFYGINSAIMCKGGKSTTITGGTVTTNAKGANGIFSYGANSGKTGATGDGTTVKVSGTKITTSQDGSGGIMTTYGGTTIANNLTIITSGTSSAPIRTDRGGGWVTVNGGTYTSSGTGSPDIYSTADVKVSNASLISKASEGVCIEGAGSISLTNCNLTATNNTLNGNATFYDTIMIYQSQSGDASDGTSSFTMTGGALTSNKGHTFHVTNTSAIITLNRVNITNSSDNVLISVCDDGWSGATNRATLNTTKQTLTGDILVGSDSSLTISLSDSSTLTGKTSGNITNGKGSTVSSSIGTINMTIDKGCSWTLTADSYVTSLTNNGTVYTNGHTLYVNGTAYTGGSSGTSSNNSSDTASGATSSAVKNGDRINMTDSDGNQIQVKVISLKNKTVSYTLKSANTTTITIPSTVTINDTTYKVTEIAANSLKKGKKTISKVIIGKNIKTIGTSAFNGCSKLKTIKFTGSTLTVSKAKAFKNINKKATITIKASKSKFNKIKKLISSSGAPSTVTYKRK